MVEKNIEWHKKYNSAYKGVLNLIENEYKLDIAQTQVLLEELLYGPFKKNKIKDS